MVPALQTRLRDTQRLIDTNSALKESSGNASKDQTVPWTPEKIAERAQKVREICGKEIKKEMKWQPSCKRGTTKWSYTGVVPTQDVFREVIHEDKNVKLGKMKKISTHDFAEIFGYIQAFVSTIFIAPEHWVKADVVSVDIMIYQSQERM
jgi:hypothetical protein